MFKQTLKLRIGKLNRLSASEEQIKSLVSIRYLNSETPKPKWDLISAVCIERHPIILAPMQDIEERFHRLLKRIEFENSFKSDHELRIEEGLVQGDLEASLDDDNMEKQVKEKAQDFEDASMNELKSFTFAPTVTEADKKNITMSVDRKLDKTLLLLTEQKIGEVFVWIPPQTHRKDGETMRQAAERAVQDNCGTEINVRFYGNAPIGFYKYKYPRSIRDQGTVGAKIFYFLAKYNSGDVSNDAKHQWLDQEELKKILHADVHKSISQFLIPS